MTRRPPGSASTARRQLDITNSWAPRVQAIWDFTGQGRGKIQANWGMYYEAIPLDMRAPRRSAPSRRLTGSYQLVHLHGGHDPGTIVRGGNPAASCPNVYGLRRRARAPAPTPATLGPSRVTGSGFSVDSPYYAPVAPGPEGRTTRDQFGGGVQYEILQDLSVGVDYLGPAAWATSSRTCPPTTAATTSSPTRPCRSPGPPTAGPYAGITFNPSNAASLDLATGDRLHGRLAEAGPLLRRGVRVTVNKLFSKKLAGPGELHLVVAPRQLPGPLPHRQRPARPEHHLRVRPGRRCSATSTGPLGGNRDQPDQGGRLLQRHALARRHASSPASTSRPSPASR